jgi:hypothetical protein
MRDGPRTFYRPDDRPKLPRVRHWTAITSCWPPFLEVSPHQGVGLSHCRRYIGRYKDDGVVFAPDSSLNSSYQSLIF